MPTSRFISKSKAVMIQEIFCGRGWIPIMSEEKRARASALDYSDSGQFLDELMAVSEKRLRRDEGQPLRPERFGNVLGLVNSRRKDLVDFLDAIKNSSDASLATHHFSLEQIRDAFELVAGYKDGVLRAMIDINTEAT